MHERLARQRRQPRPALAEVIWPADRGDRPDARLEGRGARRVVAAQAHAGRPHAAEVQIAAGGQRVEHRGDRYLVVRADVGRVSRLALPRPVERERRHPARQEGVLPAEELLLGRVQAGQQQDQRRARLVGWAAQIADQRGPLEGRLDALRGRVEQAVGRVQTFDRPLGGGAMPLHVEQPQKLGEVVAQRGTHIGLAGGAGAAMHLGAHAKPGVGVGGVAPGIEPRIPALDRGGGAHKVVVVDALGDEARRPVVDRCLHSGIGHDRLPLTNTYFFASPLSSDNGS